MMLDLGEKNKIFAMHLKAKFIICMKSNPLANFYITMRDNKTPIHINSLIDGDSCDFQKTLF